MDPLLLMSEILPLILGRKKLCIVDLIKHSCPLPAYLFKIAFNSGVRTYEGIKTLGRDKKGGWIL